MHAFFSHTAPQSSPRVLCYVDPVYTVRLLYCHFTGSAFCLERDSSAPPHTLAIIATLLEVIASNLETVFSLLDPAWLLPKSTLPSSLHLATDILCGFPNPTLSRVKFKSETLASSRMESSLASSTFVRILVAPAVFRLVSNPSEPSPQIFCRAARTLSRARCAAEVSFPKGRRRP